MLCSTPHDKMKLDSTHKTCHKAIYTLSSTICCALLLTLELLGNAVNIALLACHLLASNKQKTLQRCEKKNIPTLIGQQNVYYKAGGFIIITGSFCIHSRSNYTPLIFNTYIHSNYSVKNIPQTSVCPDSDNKTACFRHTF